MNPRQQFSNAKLYNFGPGTSEAIQRGIKEGEADRKRKEEHRRRGPSKVPASKQPIAFAENHMRPDIPGAPAEPQATQATQAPHTPTPNPQAAPPNWAESVAAFSGTDVFGIILPDLTAGLQGNFSPEEAKLADEICTGADRIMAKASEWEAWRYQSCVGLDELVTRFKRICQERETAEAANSGHVFTENSVDRGEFEAFREETRAANDRTNESLDAIAKMLSNGTQPVAKPAVKPAPARKPRKPVAKRTGKK